MLVRRPSRILYFFFKCNIRESMQVRNVWELWWFVVLWRSFVTLRPAGPMCLAEGNMRFTVIAVKRRAICSSLLQVPVVMQLCRYLSLYVPPARLQRDASGTKTPPPVLQIWSSLTFPTHSAKNHYRRMLELFPDLGNFSSFNMLTKPTITGDLLRANVLRVFECFAGFEWPFCFSNTFGRNHHTVRNIPCLDVQKGGQDLFHYEVCHQLFASV